MGEIRDRLLDAYSNSLFCEEWKKWHLRFLNLAEHISFWSKDPSTKVGAVIAQGKDVVGLGYNGFPKGVVDHQVRYDNREVKYKLVVHAELNACIMAGEKAKGGTLYVFPAFGIPPVCSECCKVIIQSGIKTVIGYNADPDDERVKRWKDSLATSSMMLTEAGIGFFGLDRIKKPVTREMVEVVRAAKCEGCGCYPYQDCPRGGLSDCWRVYNGGTRSASS